MAETSGAATLLPERNPCAAARMAVGRPVSTGQDRTPTMPRRPLRWRRGRHGYSSRAERICGFRGLPCRAKSSGRTRKWILLHSRSGYVLLAAGVQMRVAGSEREMLPDMTTGLDPKELIELALLLI